MNKYEQYQLSHPTKLYEPGDILTVEEAIRMIDIIPVPPGYREHRLGFLRDNLGARVRIRRDGRYDLVRR